MNIDDFDIGQLLGKGGFAEVYRAKNRKNGKSYAIKVVKKQRMTDMHILDRVRSEIKIHSKLKHDCIVNLVTYCEDDECIYIVLELCTGGNMFQFLRRMVKLSESDAAYIVRQLLSALAYLHQHGILHRDLKLSNILLNDSLTVKICDFGLAVQIEHPDEEHYTMCGTPNYIAPEIAAQRSHGLPADLWSIGCLFYSLVTGVAPFEHPAGVKPTLERVQSGEYVEPANLSKDALDFLRRLLELNPLKRPSVQQVQNHPFLLNQQSIYGISDEFRSPLYSLKSYPGQTFDAEIPNPLPRTSLFDPTFKQENCSGFCDDHDAKVRTSKSMLSESTMDSGEYKSADGTTVATVTNSSSSISPKRLRQPTSKFMQRLPPNHDCSSSVGISYESEFRPKHSSEEPKLTSNVRLSNPDFKYFFGESDTDECLSGGTDCSDCDIRSKNDTPKSFNSHRIKSTIYSTDARYQVEATSSSNLEEKRPSIISTDDPVVNFSSSWFDTINNLRLSVTDTPISSVALHMNKMRHETATESVAIKKILARKVRVSVGSTESMSRLTMADISSNFDLPGFQVRQFSVKDSRVYANSVDGVGSHMLTNSSSGTRDQERATLSEPHRYRTSDRYSTDEFMMVGYSARNSFDLSSGHYQRFFTAGGTRSERNSISSSIDTDKQLSSRDEVMNTEYVDRDRFGMREISSEEEDNVWQMWIDKCLHPLFHCSKSQDLLVVAPAGDVIFCKWIPAPQTERISVGQSDAHPGRLDQHGSQLRYVCGVESSRQLIRVCVRAKSPWTIQVGTVNEKMLDEWGQLYEKHRAHLSTSSSGAVSGTVKAVNSLYIAEAASELLSDNLWFASYSIYELPKSIKNIYFSVGKMIMSLKSRIPKLVLYLTFSSKQMYENSPKVVGNRGWQAEENGTEKRNMCMGINVDRCLIKPIDNCTMPSPSETNPDNNIQPHSNIHCKCMLMSNGCLPDFCIQWHDRTRLRYSLETGRLHISGPSIGSYRWDDKNSPSDVLGPRRTRDMASISRQWADSAPTKVTQYLRTAHTAMRRCLNIDANNCSTGANIKEQKSSLLGAGICLRSPERVLHTLKMLEPSCSGPKIFFDQLENNDNSF